MEAIDFWNNIKRLIKTKDITQESLSRDIGVSLGTFQSWIYSKRFPDGQQTYKIAKALGVSVESLFDDKEVDKGSAIISDLKNIINKYQ